MGGSENLFGILSLAFGLGLVHALDADHVIAVSTLSSQPRTSGLRPWWYGLRWSLGHGAALLLFGILVLGAGVAIPQQLARLAEFLVGAVLIVMGLVVFFRLRAQRLSFGFHSHADSLYHAHWHRRPEHQLASGYHHGAVLVGALHGVAGSAPLLALIPVVATGSIWLGMCYLLLFNVGVLFSMLLCGGALGVLFRRLHRFGEKVLYGARCSLAGGAVLAGGYLIKSVI
jgi:sulfite exporter TauE/SafE